MVHIIVNSITLVLRLYLYQNHLEGVLNHRLLGSSSRSSLSLALKWGQRIFIYDLFPCDTVALGLVTTHHLGLSHWAPPLLQAQRVTDETH